MQGDIYIYTYTHWYPDGYWIRHTPYAYYMQSCISPGLLCVFFKCQGMLKPWTLLWLWLKTSNPRFSTVTATWHKDVHAFQHPFSQMNQTTRQSWAFLEAPPGRMGAQPSSSPRGARQHLNAAAATAATAATVLGAVKDMSLQIQILERLDIMNCKRKRLESSEFHRF